MGFLGFLNFLAGPVFALVYPVFALVYPLCASIRAIEAGSKYQMRKLVIYWTLLSLISLFELAFVKIIEWIPFWSCMKLIFICGLVVPRFDGACHVYESFVLPCLSLNLQAVKNRFDKPIEDKPVKTDVFLDLADKYIKENGSEYLEKLIATKCGYKKPDGALSHALVREPDKNNAAATPEQVKESDSAQKYKETLEPTKKTEPTEAKLNVRSNDDSWAEKKPDAPADVIEMTTPPGSSAEIECHETPAKQVQREWTCALCLVATSCENNLKAHLMGRKHKSKLDELRTSKKNAKSAGLPPQTKEKSKKANFDTVKKPAGEGSQNKLPKCNHQFGNDQLKSTRQKRDGGSGLTSKLMCHVCKVRLPGVVDLAAHLQGKKHLFNVEQMVKF